MVKLNDKALGLLKGKNFAFLATINRDGSPQVTPVWVDTDGSRVLVNTALGRAKEKNVSRDPRVALAVADAANPYSYLSIDGKITGKTTGERADDHIDSLSYKYTGNKKYQGRTPKEKRVILSIEPVRIRALQ
ncbi:MAG: PPOX class F420-dependent oxidoreductase [Nitrososphaerales archaeon]|jgi:PPOX class probable F420-dependent enzyme